MQEFLKEKLKRLEQKNLFRTLKTVESDQGPEIVFKGKTYLNFSSNNYLGLANSPELRGAASMAIAKYGLGSGASRLITGSMTSHVELEKTIAQFKGTEAALVFNSGYLANLGVITSLVGKHDFIFSDALNHASLIDGCRLSKASLRIYRHNDTKHLEELLSVGANLVFARHKKLIITDTIFSMDGDLCPLPEIMELAEKYDAWVFVDEAHATGVMGQTGRGVVEYFKVNPNHSRLIQMGTLGKALGSFGAYVCGSKEWIEYLINCARTFIFSTSLPPAICEASKAAVELISEDSSYREQLWQNIYYFGATSPIFPLIIGDAKETMEVAQSLFEKGIWATGIRPPTVPEGTSRIRFTIMASHTRQHLDQCLEAIHEISLLG